MTDIFDEILMKASAGDMDAFKCVYDTYGRFAYNIALRVSGNSEDAEEITQDAFIKVYKNLAKFEFKSSFKTWLYRIVINAAIDFVKKAAKRRDNFISYDDAINAVNSVDEVTRNIDKEANQKLIDSLLAQLNPEQKMCIVLRSFEGLSYEEISQTLKININTVRSRLKRAREKMMKYMDTAAVS